MPSKTNGYPIRFRPGEREAGKKAASALGMPFDTYVRHAVALANAAVDGDAFSINDNPLVRVFQPTAARQRRRRAGGATARPQPAAEPRPRPEDPLPAGLAELGKILLGDAPIPEPTAAGFAERRDEIFARMDELVALRRQLEGDEEETPARPAAAPETPVRRREEGEDPAPR